MRYGILTYHSSYNFGANLQALATQLEFRRNGIENIEILNYQDKFKMDSYKRLVDPVQSTQHESFIAEYLNTSPYFESEIQLWEYCLENIDVLVVGSDAVFRMKTQYSPRNIARSILRRKSGLILDAPTTGLSPYWLNIPQNKSDRKIYKCSVAASTTGTNYIFLGSKIKKQIKECIIDFDYVSVRDKWTYDMIKRITNDAIISEICPDPVFSLKRNIDLDKYVSKLKDRYPDIEKTILISGNFTKPWIEKFATSCNNNNLLVYSLPNPESPFILSGIDGNILLPMSPLEWFAALASCAGFIGIRFHALVSCITNMVPVISVEFRNKFDLIQRKKSKVYDLCRRANIENSYFYTTRIESIEPKKVLDRLYDEKVKKNIRAYAEFAEKEFEVIIKKIIDIGDSTVS